MRTVDSIISDVYGKNVVAARRFNVGPSAVANWATRGCIPARLAGIVFEDAQKKGLELNLSDIPITGPGVAA